MNMATATNAAAIAISNTQSPSIGNANVERERENLRYLRSHGAQHRAIEFRKFLNHVDKTIPADVTEDHVIFDNLSTHKTKSIGDWFAARPRESRP